MRRGRPLRFLALALGLWICARAAIHLPPWNTEAEPAAVAAPPVAAPLVTARAAERAMSALPAPAEPTRRIADRPVGRVAPIRFAILEPPSVGSDVPRAWIAAPAPAPRLHTAPPSGPISLPAPARGRPAPRWSGSAWLLARGDGDRGSLAPGGTLGGGQAGARLAWRAGGGLSLSGRLYAPLRRPSGAEAAAGIEWQPWRRMPFHLLAERRQDLGGEGRSAFALTVYGGASGRLPGGLRGEAYAQAGVVGLDARDLFADGAARLTLPLGRIELGAGAWGAAQPGVARLDAGPSISYRLPARAASLRLQADWRVRITGDAAPGSGPALTLAVDF